MLLEDGRAVTGDADTLIAHLDGAHTERADADAHRARAAEKAGAVDANGG